MTTTVWLSMLRLTVMIVGCILIPKEPSPPERQTYRWPAPERQINFWYIHGLRLHLWHAHSRSRTVGETMEAKSGILCVAAKRALSLQSTTSVLPLPRRVVVLFKAVHGANVRHPIAPSALSQNQRCALMLMGPRSKKMTQLYSTRAQRPHMSSLSFMAQMTPSVLNQNQSCA